MKVKQLPKNLEYRNWVFRNDPELATGMAYTVKLLKSKIKSFEKRLAKSVERLRWIGELTPDATRLHDAMPGSQSEAFKNYHIRERDKLTKDIAALRKAEEMLENHVLQTCLKPKHRR